MNYRPRYTLDQKIAALDREVAMRGKVYPGRVAAGKMSQQKADHETGVMQDLRDGLAELRRLRAAQAQRNQQSLF